MIYRRTPQFHKDLECLPEAIRAKVPKAFRLFQQDPRHPSLQVKKIQRRKTTRDGKEIWEGRIDQNYRFTFHYDGDVVWFRRLGPHAIIDEEARGSA